MIAGIVLAGGEGRRIGGGKPFARLAGAPLLAHVLRRVEPQVRCLAVSVHREDDRFAAFGRPLLVDPEGVAGPLAGLLAGLEWASGHCAAAWLLTVPVDTPFLPHDLAARLVAAVDPGTEAVIAASAGTRHPTVALFRAGLAPRLVRHLAATQRRSVGAFLATLRTTEIVFATDPFDPFLNVNTPEDMAAAEALLAAGRAGPTNG